MRRRLSLVIAFIGVLGLIGLTPTAQADHAGDPPDAKFENDLPHENSPAPPVPPQIDGECLVAGEVIIGDEHNQGGVPAVPQMGKNHNHYKFEEVTINCVEFLGDHYTGAFQVRATGGTDGPGECDGMPGKDPKCQTTDHGEDAAAGWSHSSCYTAAPDSPGCVFGAAKDPKVTWTVLYAGTKVNPSTNTTGCYNCGEITVESLDAAGNKDDRKDSTSPDNFVKFCRGIYDDNGDGEPDCQNVVQGGMPTGGTHASTGGGNVLAWGQLEDITGKAADEVLCFLADLEFTPTQQFTDDGGVVKFNGAQLEGTASIWVVGGDTDKTKADCEGKKNKT